MAQNSLAERVLELRKEKGYTQEDLSDLCQVDKRTIQRIEKGEVKPEEVPMCGHCQHYGKLMDAGAKFEYVPGEAAEVIVMWSDKPEVVTQIKEFAQRNRDELAKMEAAKEAKHE